MTIKNAYKSQLQVKVMFYKLSIPSKAPWTMDIKHKLQL